MKIINIEELKRNPYYSNGFLRAQRELRRMACADIFSEHEGRPFTLRKMKKIAAMHEELDAIERIITDRNGGDRDTCPLRGTPKTIDITKHEAPKRKRSR